MLFVEGDALLMALPEELVDLCCGVHLRRSITTWKGCPHGLRSILVKLKLWVITISIICQQDLHNYYISSDDSPIAIVISAATFLKVPLCLLLSTHDIKSETSPQNSIFWSITAFVLH